MFEPMCLVVRRAGMVAAMAGLMMYTAAVEAKSAESAETAAMGRIDFESAKLPPANVELDLSQAMFQNLFGVSDAAIAGVAETLMKSKQGEHAEAVHLAAEQLAAVRQVVGLAGKVVKEVRIRAYEKNAEDLSSRFETQLRNGEWEKVVVVRKGDESARVFVISHNDSIRGAFVMASNHDGQVLVNLVCDISPENVKSLTSAATKIGLDNNLAQAIAAKFRKVHGPNPVNGPRPPRPPQPAKPAE